MTSKYKRSKTSDYLKNFVAIEEVKVKELCDDFDEKEEELFLNKLTKHQRNRSTNAVNNLLSEGFGLSKILN